MSSSYLSKRKSPAVKANYDDKKGLGYGVLEPRFHKPKTQNANYPYSDPDDHVDMEDQVDVNPGAGHIQGKSSGRQIGVGDSVRGRIVSLSFDTTDPRRSKIGLTSKQTGLGCHDWIDEDNTKGE